MSNFTIEHAAVQVENRLVRGRLVEVKIINLITLYEEFSAYLGLTIDQDPRRRDFPRFVRFLDEQYPDWSDAAFELWNDMGMNISI